EAGCALERMYIVQGDYGRIGTILTGSNSASLRVYIPVDEIVPTRSAGQSVFLDERIKHAEGMVDTRNKLSYERRVSRPEQVIVQHIDPYHRIRGVHKC